MDGKVLSSLEEGKMVRKDNTIREPLLKKISRTKFANVVRYDSLNYKIVENDFTRKHRKSRTKMQKFVDIVFTWMVPLLIGLATALVGFSSNLIVQNIVGYKMSFTTNFMKNQRFFLAFLTYSGSNLVLAGATAILCAYVAPQATGSGIPELKTYLNGVDIGYVLSPITLFVKTVGSIGGVSAGFVMGKEGPMAHSGACISDLFGRNKMLNSKWLKHFNNDRNRRDLATCGAAAGVAAAFRAPIGGAIFAFEEAISWWRHALSLKIFFTSGVVVLVLKGLNNICRSTGKCGFMRVATFIMFDINSTTAIYGVLELVGVIFLGAVGGLFGALFNFILNHIQRVYNTINKQGPIAKILLTISVSFITSSCFFGLPWLGTCTSCPESLNYKPQTMNISNSIGNLYCLQVKNKSNDLGSLFLGTNDLAIYNLYSNSTEYNNIPSLLIHFVTVYLLGLITYGTAVPSGLFVPVLLSGASLGRIFGTVSRHFLKLDVGLWAVLGSASLLGGTMRVPFSACVILLELTNNLQVIPLVIVVTFVSTTVANCINKSVYDQILEMKGFPFLELHSESYMRDVVVGDIVSRLPITFSGIETVGNILQALSLTKHNGFPVVDGSEFRGVVLRSHILVLLKMKEFKTVTVSSDATEGFISFDCFPEDLSLEELDISEEDFGMYVDLLPITNTSTPTVHERMSLLETAQLFRDMELRHLCVVPKRPEGLPVVGILTRHDLMPDYVIGLISRVNPKM